MILENILQEYEDESLLLADGFEEACIGIYDGFKGKPRLVYSTKKCIETLINRDNMTYEEAVEYFDFNTGCAWVGEQTPIFVEDRFE